MREGTIFTIFRKRAAAVLLGAAAIGPAVTSPAARAACNPDQARSSISYAKTVEPLLQKYCTPCHLTPEAPEALMFESGVSYFYMVGIPSKESDLLRVAPGEPDRSYLIHKIRGTHLEVGGLGERMPFGAPPVTDDEVGLIAAWIKDCSPNN